MQWERSETGVQWAMFEMTSTFSMTDNRVYEVLKESNLLYMIPPDKFFQVAQQVDLPPNIKVLGIDIHQETLQYEIRFSVDGTKKVTLRDPIDGFPSERFKAKLLALS